MTEHHALGLLAQSEGLIITDGDGNIVLANDEARRLLDGVELADLARDDMPVRDQLRVAAGRVLLVSRSTAEVDEVPVGMVTTLRDRTELQQALNELDDVRALAAALREQSHESANRLQALVGLVELGRYDDAVRLGTRDAAVAQRLSDEMVGQVADPALAALLLGKTVLAEQRGVELRLHARGTVSAKQGIGAGHLDDVFTMGWTTKPSERPGGRGLGLALVRHTVTRLGGTITARNDEGGGAVFEARVPAPAPSRSVRA